MTGAFIILASLVVILAGIKAAASLVVPFLLAAFLAVLLAGPYLTLKRVGVPGWTALIIMIVALGTVGILTVEILRASLDQFSSSLPQYEANLRAQLNLLWEWLKGHGITAPDEFVTANLDPQLAMNYLGGIAKALSGVLGQAFLIFLVVAFMLLEASGLPQKLRNLPGITEEAFASLEKTLGDVRRYVVMKSLMSLLTGVLVALWLTILGIDNALFMGLLAFMLNFVPAIGSVIAGVPGVLLGFIQFGPLMALVTAVGYLAVNIGVSNVIEPRFMGRGLGLSPLIVVVSLIFWGWLLGPVGMLLSVPLTMVTKVGLESSESTRPIAVLLGPAPR